MSEVDKIGRKPFFYCQLEMDSCANVYNSLDNQNLIYWSEELDKWYIGVDSIITPNAGNDPNGNLTADKFSYVNLGNNHVGQDYTANSEINYDLNYSIYVYPLAADSIINLRWILNGVEDSRLEFPLLNVNEWVRIDIPITIIAPINVIVSTNFFDSSNIIGDRFLVWGGQLTEGLTVKPYNKTLDLIQNGCKANNAIGLECYNTFSTCQDRLNFLKTTKNYLFSSENSKQPNDFEAYPVIKGQPQLTPVTLEPNNGVGKRGAITLTFNDFKNDDFGVDPYVKTRAEKPEGGFFARFRRRNPFYNNAPFKLFSGYINENNDLVETYERLYFVTAFDGVDKKGNFKITGKDILKFTQDKAAIIPPPINALLSADMDATQLTATLRPGDAQRLFDSNLQNFTIDDEVFSWAGLFTGDVITITGRNSGGTTATDHKSGSIIKLLVNISTEGFIPSDGTIHAIDAIYKLLTIYAGIDKKYIPYNNDPINPDEWDIEKNNWLIDNFFRNWRLISEQKKVADILKEICEQNSISLWWDEREQKIKLSGSTIALGNETPLDLTDKENLLYKSFEIREDINNRFTQVWIHYGQFNKIKNVSEIENYQFLDVFINTDAENKNAYGEVNIKTVYANWLESTNAQIIPGIAAKLLQKDLMQEYFVTFELDAKDAGLLWTGQYCLLKTDSVVNEKGQQYIQKVHINKVQEIKNGHKFKYSGFSQVYIDPDISGQIIFIARNDLIDYDSSIEEDKNTNFFLSDGELAFSDGRPPYIISE